MKKYENELIQFLIGIVMLCAGGYMFASNVIVRTGFHVWIFGGLRIHTGLTIIPFVIGVIMLFASPRRFLPKLVCGLGLMIILLSIIMGTDFYFRSTSLYVYLIMIVGIFGGLGLVIKSLFSGYSSKKQ